MVWFWIDRWGRVRAVCQWSFAALGSDTWGLLLTFLTTATICWLLAVMQVSSAYWRRLTWWELETETYHGLQLETCYRRHENEKRRAYEQRVRELENGSFTPLFFSTSRGMGKAAKITYKRLASLLSIKCEQPYSLVMGWLRCRLSFSLLRSAVMCLRGCRSKKGHIPLSDTHIELVVHEGRLPLSS